MYGAKTGDEDDEEKEHGSARSQQRRLGEALGVLKELPGSRAAFGLNLPEYLFRILAQVLCP